MLRMFSRYFAVQVLAYGIDFGLFLLLTHVFDMHALYSNVVGKLAAGAFAFIAHRRFSFGADGHGNARSQLLRYVLLLGLNIPVSSALLAMLLTVIAYPALAKMLSDAICIGGTFLLSKHFIFTAPRSARDSDA